MTETKQTHSPPILKGRNVRLEPFTVDNITPAYLSWLVDPVVNQYSHRLGASKPTAEEAREWVSLRAKDEIIFAISTEDFGHIGNIKYGPVNWANCAADISILIGSVESWGNGFGREATYLVSKHLFLDRGLNRLFAGSVNPGYIRMVEKLGWQREGIQREEARVAGTFADSVLLSLLKREFVIDAAYEMVER
jgi:RimJ/RimL family protein N-acetyltransferase